MDFMIEQFKDRYRWLSNFTPCSINLDGINYRSVEHAYMSAKSNDLKWKYFCRDTYNPVEVKKASRKIKLVYDWDKVKIDIMEKCIDQKFNQEPFLTKLLATGDQHIQEGNYWGDKFWGVDLKTGKGKNILGILIMGKRESLKKGSINTN